MPRFDRSTDVHNAFLGRPMSEALARYLATTAPSRPIDTGRRRPAPATGPALRESAERLSVDELWDRLGDFA